jgi:hypothetical protein
VLPAQQAADIEEEGGVAVPAGSQSFAPLNAAGEEEEEAAAADPGGDGMDELFGGLDLSA